MPLPRLRSGRRQDPCRHPQCHGPVERLTDSQQRPTGDQEAEARGDRRGRRGQRPPHDRRGIGPAEVPPIDEVAGGDLEQCVGEVERREDPAEVGRRCDPEVPPDRPVQERDRLAVHGRSGSSPRTSGQQRPKPGRSRPVTPRHGPGPGSCRHQVQATEILHHQSNPPRHRAPRGPPTMPEASSPCNAPPRPGFRPCNPGRDGGWT